MTLSRHCKAKFNDKCCCQFLKLSISSYSAVRCAQTGNNNHIEYPDDYTDNALSSARRT